MKNQRSIIAERVRGLRDASEVTQSEVAAKTSVPLEVYQKYENGETDVPMSYITVLASFYHVDPTAILTGGDAHAKCFHVTRKGTGPVIERRNVYHYEALGALFKGRMMEPYIVTVEPSLKELHLNSHPGQEFNYILSGKLLLVIDGSEMVLEPGDSVYFDATLPHGMRTEGNAPATFMAIITA